MLVLTGCGSAKRKEIARAKDLYNSVYFKKKRAYAEAVGNRWLILSAEHGVVEPDEALAPYDTTIQDVDPVAWGERILEELPDLAGVEVIVLAGAAYLDPIQDGLESRAAAVRTPTEGMRIGERVAWLSEHTETDARDVQADDGDGDGDEMSYEDHVQRWRELLALGVTDTGVFNVSVSTVVNVLKHYVDPGADRDDLRAAIRERPGELPTIEDVGPRTANVFVRWAMDDFEGLLKPSEMPDEFIVPGGLEDKPPGRGPPGADRFRLTDTEGTTKLQLERGDAVRVDYYNTIAKADDSVRGVIERIREGADPDDTEFWLSGDVRVTGLTQQSRVIIDGRSRGWFRNIRRLFGPDVPEQDDDDDDNGEWSVDALAAAIENVVAAGEPTVTRQAGRATIDFKLPVASDAPFASSLEYDPDEGHITGLALRFSPDLLVHTSDGRLEELFEGILDRTDPPGGTVWTSYSEGDARETGPHILAPGGFSELDPGEVVPWLDRVLEEYRRVFE